MSRRSRHHGDAEPDIISPEASRMNRGVHLGSGSQRNRAALGGPGPHSRRPDHAAGVRRGGGLYGLDDDEQINSRLGSRDNPGRSSQRGEGVRAPFHDHDFAQGPPLDFFREDDLPEAKVNLHGPPQPRGGRHDLLGTHENHRSGRTRVPLGAQRNRSRGGRPDILEEEHGFGDRNARVNQIEEMDDLSLPGLAERQPFEAVGARAGRHHPSSQRHGPVSRGREPIRHNERHGGPRCGVGSRAPSASIDTFDEPDAGSSDPLLKHRGADGAKGRKEKGVRFVPYTFRTLPPEHAHFLAKIFKVRLSKIEDWCKEDLIRMDKKLAETNIDLLMSRLSSEDRERYEHQVQTMKNEREIMKKRLGLTHRHEATDYELGYYAGQESALYERRDGGHGGGRHR